MYLNPSVACQPRTHSRPLLATPSRRVAAALALTFLFLSGVSAAPPGHVTHVVVFWLKRPGNVEDRNRLARASEEFRTLPGVLAVETGRPLPVRRPGIEQSFDLCVVITFRNQRALARFESDPRHKEVVRSVLRPLVRKYWVFNTVAD